VNPRYPVYIVSKGRWQSRVTARHLTEIGVPFRIVVEPQEFDDYAAVIDPAWILTLPFSNLGQGSIPARNWIWEHSISEGHARHWIMDDNIQRFYRLHCNAKRPIADGTVFVVMEAFVDRYQNVVMAGPNYEHLAKHRQRLPPVYLNHRVYSCILLANDVPHRWRGRYNEDTDLSLRFLKDGYCTVLFNAFLAKKRPTMTMSGGNTESLYILPDGTDGRLLMAQSLQQQHPDVTRITRKFGRWQHQVDYRPFKHNRLIRKPGLEIPSEPNEYGLRLVTVAD
jgi:hypothetical protein